MPASRCTAQRGAGLRLKGKALGKVALVARIRLSSTIRMAVKTPIDFQIRPTRVEDVPIILELIRDLATYERAPHEVIATEEQLADVSFGEKPASEFETSAVPGRFFEMPDHFRIGMGVNTEMFAEGLNRLVAHSRAIAVAAETAIQVRVTVAVAG